MPERIRNVVVIEDDAGMRQSIERLLGAAGYPCRAYASAEEFRADAARADAACIVSDLRLPAMSGLELLAQLRASGKETPLILITAHDAPGLRDEALKGGAAAYFTKPFRGTALLQAIRKAAGHVAAD